MNTSNYPISDWLYRKILLSPLGLDRENSFVIWILLVFALMLSGGLYFTNGNAALVVGAIYFTFVLLLSLFRIDYSLYLFLFTVLLFDQYPIPGFTSITHDVRFFQNLKEISYIPYSDAAVLGPFEIHIFFLVVAFFIHVSIRKSFTFKPIIVWGSFGLFFAILAFSFINGLRGGGDFMIALWEVRALFYLCVMYILVSQIIDTKEQISILFWMFIVGITIKALQGVFRFIDLGFTTGGYAVLTNHEDPVFAITLFILLIGFLLFGTGEKQRNWLLFFLFPLLLGFYVAQRRASYASFIVCIAALVFILPTLKRVQFLKFLFPVLLLVSLYGATFWNNYGTLGRPVQMIKSGFVEPELETNFQDYSSNLYRENENYNLAQTVVNNPVLGTGFGKKYDQPIPLINIRFSLRDYIPHNQIYWVLVKTGAVGFFVFWFFFNSFAARGTQIFIRLKDPYLKAVTLVIVLAVINQMVVSFFDLQLTYYRSMIYLGSLMGLLSVINHIDENPHLSKGHIKESFDE